MSSLILSIKVKARRVCDDPGIIIRKIKQIIKAAYNYLTSSIGYGIIIPLTYLVPKNKNYVVLITRFGDFEGNIKYLLTYLDSLSEDRSFIFLTEKTDVYQILKNNNMKVWLYPRLLTIISLLRTPLIIVDGNEWANNFKFFFLYNCKKVQIWHGTGLKTIGLLKPNRKNMNKFRLKFKKENIFYDLLTLSSKAQVEARSAAFRYGQLLINGLPRNDVFFKEDNFDNYLGSDRSTLTCCRNYKQNGMTLIIYSPTWRKETNLFNHLNLVSINEFTRQHNIIFIIKLHPKHKFKLDLRQYSNIIEYNKNADVYPLLPLTDLMITDYSSIYLDYLLLDRPIIFYPYDSEEYIGKERELLLDYNNVTPGAICYNQDSLEKEIYEHIISREDIFKKQRNKLKGQFFKYADGKSSERLWFAIKKDLLGEIGHDFDTHKDGYAGAL